MGVLVSPGSDPGPARPPAPQRRATDPAPQAARHAAFVQERRYLRWLAVAFGGPGIVGRVIPAERTGR